MKFKRQNIFLTIVLIILISITLGISYAFLQTSFFASKESILKVGSLALVLDESDGNAITVSADGPLSDSEGVNLDNYYSFKLTNNGKVASSYTIYLDNQPLDDGDVRINQKYIHYSLEKDESNNIAKSLTGNQKLESGIINSKQTINYKLRLWFSSDMTIEEENKVFKAKLRIEGVSTSEENLNKKCQDAGGDSFIDGECRKYYVMKNNIAVVRQGSYAKLIANSDGSYTFSTDGLTYLANSIATTTTSMKSVGHNYYYNINILSMVEKLGHNSEKILEFAHKTVIDGIEYWPKTQFIYSLNATGMYTGIIVSNSEKDHFYIESYDWAEFTFRDYMIIDLTLMFGEGNEPSKEWCDKNLTSYIEYNESGVKTPISDINYTGKTSYYDVISMYK
jgi:hypothetical protein